MSDRVRMRQPIVPLPILRFRGFNLKTAKNKTLSFMVVPDPFSVQKYMMYLNISISLQSSTIPSTKQIFIKTRKEKVNEKNRRKKKWIQMLAHGAWFYKLKNDIILPKDIGMDTL